MKEKEKVLFGFRTDTEKEKWIADIVSVLKDKEIHAPLEVFLAFTKGFSKEFVSETTLEVATQLEKVLDNATTGWITLKPCMDISLLIIREYEGKSNYLDGFKPPF